MGLAGLPFKLDCDGGVDPEENFELRLEIHEFRRPPTGLGALRCGAGDRVDGGFCSADLFSLGGAYSSTFPKVSWLSWVSWGSRFGSGVPEDVGRAGLLLDRVLRCEVDVADTGSFSVRELSLVVDVTDFVRWR